MARGRKNLRQSARFPGPAGQPRARARLPPPLTAPVEVAPAASVVEVVEVGLDQVLRQLRSEDRRRQVLEDHQVQLVAQARELGASWAQLGRVLGRTGQAVSMRYGSTGGSS